MKYMVLLSNKDREGLHCCFCGTNKSVKYQVKLAQKDGKDGIYATCCNKCVLLMSDYLM